MPETLIGIFLDTVDRHRKSAQFMRKVAGRWESIPAERALADVECLALGLRELGVGRGDRVAILSESRYEWAVADLAILGLGASSVPLYPTLTGPQCQAILADAGASVAVVSNVAQLDKMHAIAAALPGLRAIVPREPSPPNGPIDRDWHEVVRRGAERRAAAPGAFREAAAAVGPGDVATLIYTSGTTGEPKGAVLTHGNIASNVASCLSVIDLAPTDVQLSFLPLCHIFERMAGLYAMLAGGVTIAYAESIDTVARDAQVVRPTVLTGVPRFYEKVHDRVMENAIAQPPLRRAIFFACMNAGRRAAHLRFRRRPVPWTTALLARVGDRLVFSKIRERIGGRLRFAISGGAALSPRLMEFFFAVGIPILEGYGLTETSPVVCLNPRGREKPGSVGPPIPGVEVRIGDQDEILTRGPHVMQGYHDNPAATAACIRDGWFHTGDVGFLDADGYLYITDRLKDILVTAGGKNVAPQPIEERLKARKWVAEAVLIGDHRPYVVALLVPAFAVLEAEARARGWTFMQRGELLARPEVRAIYQAEVDRVNADLAPFEQLKTFALLDRELSQDAGELTPTLKVKRRVILQKFGDVIESLYAWRPPAPGA
jgi:long-chain acyl-CoA synthetase